MQKLIFLFPLFLSFSLFAQNGPINPLSARSNSVANASVAFTGINSLFNNQAGLADLENMGLLLSAQETFRGPYSDNMGGGFAIPTSSGTFGLHFHYFGAADIRQNKFGLAYARRLMEKLSIGIQFDLVNTEISEYDRSNLFTIEIGVQYELIENILIGIHLYNPAKLEIVEDEYLPNIFRIGATYFVSKKIMLHSELEKDLDFSFVFKNGFECELVNHLWFRIGFQNKPTTYNFGLGYLFKKGLRFDLAAYYQQGLDLNSSGIFGSSGFVPSFNLGYDFVKKRNQ